MSGVLEWVCFDVGPWDERGHQMAGRRLHAVLDGKSMCGRTPAHGTVVDLHNYKKCKLCQRVISKAEERSVKALKALAENWPPSLWLFVDGSVHVMRLNDDGERAGLGRECGGVDAAFEVAEVSIPSDGGGW